MDKRQGSACSFTLHQYTNTYIYVYVCVNAYYFCGKWGIANGIRMFHFRLDCQQLLLMHANKWNIVACHLAAVLWCFIIVGIIVVVIAVPIWPMQLVATTSNNYNNNYCNDCITCLSVFLLFLWLQLGCCAACGADTVYACSSTAFRGAYTYLCKVLYAFMRRFGVCQQC